MTLDDAITAVHAAGFRLSLNESQSGRWMAIALGDNLEMGLNGAMYTRACGFGRTAGDALADLGKNLKANQTEGVDDLV